MLMTGGGHLGFSYEKVDEQIETFFQSFRVNISETLQLFNICMKSPKLYFVISN